MKRVSGRSEPNEETKTLLKTKILLILEVISSHFTSLQQHNVSTTFMALHTNEGEINIQLGDLFSQPTYFIITLRALSGNTAVK